MKLFSSNTSKSIDDTKIEKCDELRIREAHKDDFDKILKYLFDEFLPEEPLSKSISLYKDKEGSTALLAYIINKSLKYPLTAIVENRHNGDVAAVRLMSIGERGDDKHDEVRQLE